jgi:hypothetical protein
MIKDVKRLIVIPMLFGMSIIVWTMWSLIDVAYWVMESIEQAGGRFFEWAEK